MGTENFTKKLTKKSGIEEEKEELLGVENMIKVVDLERKVRGLEEDIEEKVKKLEEKKKLYEEIVKKKDKNLEEKDKVIERLKAQLKNK